MSQVSNLTAPAARPAAESRLGGGRAWLIWSIAVVFVVWLFNVQTGYAILNNGVSKELNLGPERIGIIAAVYTWTFAIAQLFSGALLDRLGSRMVLLPAIALVAVGVFLFSFAQNFEMLLLSQVVLAIGSSAGFVGAGYVGGVWFGMAKFGFMFGLVQLVAALSSAFGQTGFDFAVRTWTWRQLTTGFGIFGVALLLVAALYVRNPVEVKSEKSGFGSFVASILGSIAEVLKKVQIWIISISGAVTFGAILALGVVWMPKILVSHGIELSSANHATAALWLGLAVGSPVIARLSDIMRKRRSLIIVTNLVQLVVFALVLYLPVNTVLAMALCFIFGFANAGHMLAFSAAADNVPGRLIGTSASIVNGSMFIVGGIMMSLPGSLLEGTRGDLPAFQGAMLPTVVALAAALAISLLIKESYPRQDA